MTTERVETYENGVRVSTETRETSPERANGEAIVAAARNALAANRAYLNQAQSAKTASIVRDQVDALTRQMNGIVRLLLGALDAAD